MSDGACPVSGQQLHGLFVTMNQTNDEEIPVEGITFWLISKIANDEGGESRRTRVTRKSQNPHSEERFAHPRTKLVRGTDKSEGGGALRCWRKEERRVGKARR